MRLIFKGFNLPRPRFLQYLKVNLKVFAYCSESLRKRFRSFQNAPKRSARGLPDPSWEALGVPWGAKLVPKNVQEAHKASKRTGKWFPWDRQSVPKAPQDVLEGPQVVPKGSPRVPKRSPRIPKKSPRDPQGVPKVPQWVPRRSPRGPQGLPKGFPRATGRLRSRWNDGVAPKSAALRRRVRPVHIHSIYHK